jgi:hypothetical protein
LPNKPLLFLVALALPALAGPVEFGMAEVQRAIADRGLKPNVIRFNAEINGDAPETFRIFPGRIAGGDLRGLMYGLLEAAEQIRDTGRLASVRGTPATPLRGVRYVLDSEDLPPNWSDYFALLARNRFNRFHLVFTEPPAALARHLGQIRSISEAAADYGIDFILGLEPEGSQSYSYESLRRALRACPAVRGLELRLDTAASRDAAIRAIAHAGRRVVLELPTGPVGEAVINAADTARVHLRAALPYPPLKNQPKTSYECYWSLPSERLLLWGDPEFVRHAVAAFGSNGFEIDAPALRGQPDRHWFFYLLWGRLSYDPRTRDRVWLTEFKRRYGASASDVLALYQAVSPVPAQAARVEALLDRLRGKVKLDSDFEAAALLARCHSHRLLANEQVARFDQTGDAAALDTARHETIAAIAASDKLATLGPWKDKLPDLRRDLQLIDDRREIFQQFGRFDFGFNFGGEAPRFETIGPSTTFSAARGFGWLTGGDRVAHTADSKPLYGDWIQGRGPQVFRVRVPSGVYSVFFLDPSGSATARRLRAVRGYLDITLPEGEWRISGLVLKAVSSRP